MTNSEKRIFIVIILLLSVFSSFSSYAAGCPVQKRDGQITRVVGNFPTASANFDAVLVSSISVPNAGYVWCASAGTLANSAVSSSNSIPHICQPRSFNVPFEASARIITTNVPDLRVKGWSLNCPPSNGSTFIFS